MLIAGCCGTLVKAGARRGLDAKGISSALTPPPYEVAGSDDPICVFCEAREGTLGLSHVIILGM